MAQLAIKGHATRGKEVIGILEMLGGVNTYAVSADEEELPFTIRDDDSIMVACYPTGEFVIYTLEEFLEKFPYKVGDRVRTIYGKIGIISKPIWSKRDDCIRYELEADTDSFYFVNELQPYKEDIVEERKYADLRLDVDQDDKLATEVTIDGDKITAPENYLIGKVTKVGNGVLVEFVKKQPQYPKTYEECCEIIHSDPKFYVDTHLYSDTLEVLYKLLICRDAYWKIAGEEMGLDKPWEPDWNNSSQFKDVIICRSNNIIKYAYAALNTTLAFPTEEMRDAFYENFKDLIEDCKEFL